MKGDGKMSLIEKKKRLYKKMLAALIATTATLGMTGCNNSEIGSEDEYSETMMNNGSEYDDATFQQEPLGKKYLPAAIMDSSKTKMLTTGTYIEAEDITEMPNENTLEMMDKAVCYWYSSNTEQDGKLESKKYALPYPEFLYPDGAATIMEEDGKEVIHFLGIEIVDIVDYRKDEDGKYEKYIRLDSNNNEIVSAGLVLSESKIEELDGNQKVLK